MALPYAFLNILTFCILAILCSTTTSKKLSLLGTKTNQSSTQFQYTADKAVDGKKIADGGKSACTLTGDDANAWWRIQLDKIYIVESVKIYNNVGDYKRLQKLNIAVGYVEDIVEHSLCRFYKNTVPSGGSATIHCNKPSLGNYVSIQRTSRQTYNEDGTFKDNDGYLSLCEVEIYGYEAQIPLKKSNARQSSGTYPYGPENAVDGKTELTGNIYSCTHTSEEAKPWWRIRLDQVYMVKAVKVYNRKNTYRRLRQLNVTVGTTENLAQQSLCKFYKNIVPSSGTALIECSTVLRGTYVAIQKTTRAEYTDGGVKVSENGGFLTLCEVEIYGYKVVTCGSPPPASRATWTGSDFTYWGAVIYKCNEGYGVVSGDAERRCGADGKWTGTSVSCQRLTCPTPPKIPNAKVTGSDVMPGAVVTYSCKTGFGRASETIRCGADGRWSKINIKCFKINCGVPPAISNAEWRGTNWTHGATVRYSCKTGSTFESGDQIRRCGADSRWDGINIRCRSPVVVTAQPPVALNLPLWIGVAVGCLVFLCLICLIVFCLVRRRVKEQEARAAAEVNAVGNPAYEYVAEDDQTLHDNIGNTEFERVMGKQKF